MLEVWKLVVAGAQMVQQRTVQVVAFVQVVACLWESDVLIQEIEDNDHARHGLVVATVSILMMVVNVVLQVMGILFLATCALQNVSTPVESHLSNVQTIIGQ